MVWTAARRYVDAHGVCDGWTSNFIPSIFPYSLLPTREHGLTQVQPHFGRCFNFTRISAKVLVTATLFVLTLLYLSRSFQSSKSDGVDWTRFAYVQYATNQMYLCNPVMLFETLHRLGSKADRLLMYPSNFLVDDTSSSDESRLLIKARDEYNVKLQPVEVQHRQVEDRECTIGRTSLD